MNFIINIKEIFYIEIFPSMFKKNLKSFTSLPSMKGRRFWLLQLDVQNRIDTFNDCACI